MSKEIPDLLKAERERLRFALEGTNRGVWDWYIVTNEIYFSPKWKEMLGYTDTEIGNKYEEWTKRIHPDDLAAIEQEIANAIKIENYDYCIEHRLLCKDGTYKWIEAKGKVLERLPTGEAARMICTQTDISKLKAHEEALERSEEKYRSVIENSPVIIMIADLDENITYINFSGGERAVDQIIGQSLYNFVLPEYHSLVRNTHKIVIEKKVLETYETETMDLNGEKLWFQTQVGPILSNNKVTGITMFSLNITVRKNAEEKLKQSLKEKEVLLKEVHHRVKNNLQIISSILNLQTSKTSSKKTLEIIHDSQLRIKSMSLIHELLYRTNDFSRINFSRYIKEILANLITSFTKNESIQFEIEVGDVYLNLDLSIPCGLIINELITNAFKYAFPDFAKGKLKINLLQEGTAVTLIIADTGKGLPAPIDYRNTKTLGMQLVMTLVEQIEGTIELDNTNGAKYTIRFSSATFQPTKLI